MRTLLAVCMLLAISILGAGCRKGQEETGTPQAQPTKPPPKDTGKGGVVRGKQRLEIQNDLKQLATYYQMHKTPLGKGPAKLDALRQELKREFKAIDDAIENGSYVVVAGAPTDGIVAYEKHPDQYGRHVVAFFGPRVEDLNTNELDAKLKEQGAPPR